MKRTFQYLIVFLLLTSFTEEKQFCDFIRDYTEIKYSGKDMNEFLYVAVRRQKMYHILNWKVVGEYDISTSSKGVGSEKGSEKTPLGLHRITKKIGNNIPEGGIISGAVYTGKIAYIEKSAKSIGTDDLTSRALRLEGLESGINKGGNKDSFERDIYIHGTPEEGLIGKPVSHGCVRMRNSEIIHLYNKINEGTLVLIVNN